jgi:hypothetical protein
MMHIKAGSEIQQTYKEYVNQKRFSELAKLIERSKTKPADYIVRIGFKSYIEQPQGNRVKLFSIMKLKEITGIKPDNNVMKLVCEMAMEMDSPEVIEALIKRLDIEKAVFHDMGAFLQKTYNKYVNEGRFVDISRLMELTESIPSGDIIQKGYEYYLEEGKMISFAGLRKRTGVEPDESMVRSKYSEYYGHYLKSKNVSREKAQLWIDRIKKLKRISRIDPPENIKLAEMEEELPDEEPDVTPEPSPDNQQP